ncbi:MAG: type IV toxin-antitoxin system AbiEi family antitoxin [Gammaproteobacteria bacterium]|jgi:predicted transcriptional regulator of viral defense system
MDTKSIGTEYRHKLAEVVNASNGIITPMLVSKTLNVSQQEAGRLLSRWNRQTWVKRIKKGVYIPVAANDITGNLSIEEPWILANNLFAPGYIGGFSAVKHWDLSEQIIEVTTFFTTKKVKERYLVIGDSRFRLKTILPYKIFGTKNAWVENVKIPVSDPTKTIVDLLDDPTLVGGMRIVKDVVLEYKKSEYFDLDKLILYAEKMKNKTIFKRFGYLMENIGLNEMIDKYNLTDKISAGYSTFDPGVKNKSIVRKWKLWIPEIWKNKND